MSSNKIAAEWSTFKCAFCGTEHGRKKIEVDRYENNFCNRSCQGSFRKKDLNPKLKEICYKCHKPLKETDKYLQTNNELSCHCKACRDKERVVHILEKQLKRMEFVKR